MLRMRKDPRSRGSLPFYDRIAASKSRSAMSKSRPICYPKPSSSREEYHMSVAESLGAGLDLDTRKMVLETIREYGVKNFPHSKLIELDKENHFPTKEMTDLYDPEQIACNLIMIPEKYGGLGGNSYDIYRACE